MVPSFYKDAFFIEVLFIFGGDKLVRSSIPISRKAFSSNYVVFLSSVLSRLCYWPYTLWFLFGSLIDR